MTVGWRKSAEYLLNALLPDDNPNTDTETQVQLRSYLDNDYYNQSFVRYLDNTMGSVAMIQFCVSVLLVCVALFQATNSTDSTAVLKCAIYLPMPGTQVFLYCWAAHNVTEQAEAVSLSAYSSSWVDTGRRIKQALRIIISRAQKPLVLTAGRIYPIDREAFVSLVNASYSFYALLASMSKR